MSCSRALFVATLCVIITVLVASPSTEMRGRQKRYSNMCGGVLNSPDGGTFTSPNYPSNYPVDVNCQWLITAPQGERVTVILEAFSLQPRWDYLEMYDGAGTYGNPNRLVLLNQDDMPAVTSYTSCGNHMLVEFYSDEAYTYPGFSAQYMYEIGDIDECDPSPCDPNASCEDIEGQCSYICTCNDGYAGDGFTCTVVTCPTAADVDHGTLTGPTELETGATYYVQCDAGYEGDANRECQIDGTWSGDEPVCTVIDECASSSCDPNAACSYMCTCSDGYEGDGFTCTDTIR